MTVSMAALRSASERVWTLPFLLALVQPVESEQHAGFITDDERLPCQDHEFVNPCLRLQQQLLLRDGGSCLQGKYRIITEPGMVQNVERPPPNRAAKEINALLRTQQTLAFLLK